MIHARASPDRWMTAHPSDQPHSGWGTGDFGSRLNGVQGNSIGRGTEIRGSHHVHHRSRPHQHHRRHRGSDEPHPPPEAGGRDRRRTGPCHRRHRRSADSRPRRFDARRHRAVQRILIDGWRIVAAVQRHRYGVACCAVDSDERRLSCTAVDSDEQRLSCTAVDSDEQCLSCTAVDPDERRLARSAVDSDERRLARSAVDSDERKRLLDDDVVSSLSDVERTTAVATVVAALVLSAAVLSVIAPAGGSIGSRLIDIETTLWAQAKALR